MELDYVLDRSVLLVLAVMGIIGWIWMLQTKTMSALLLILIIESVLGFFVMLVVFGITIRIYDRWGEKATLAFTIALVTMIALGCILKFPVEVKYYVHVNRGSPVLNTILTALILAYPLIAVLVYLIFGREKDFVVPKYLSYVPNRNRKPWLVNFVFKGDAITLDIDGVVATILDLYRRGYIELLNDGKVKVVKEDGDLDGYERKVMGFIRKYSRGGVFDPKLIKWCIYRKSGVITLEKMEIDPKLDKKVYSDLSNDISSLFLPGDRTTKTYYSFLFPVGKFYNIKLIDLKGRNVFALTLFMAMAFSLLFPYTTLSLGLFFQSLICYSTPTQLFGRWRDDYYREKLEWMSFARYIENFAMIKKYTPEDISIWDDWLVYGTAMGVARSVLKFMSPIMSLFFEAIYPDLT